MSNFFVAVGCGSFAQKLRGAHACGLALRLSIENAVLEQLQPCIRAAMTQLFAACQATLLGPTINKCFTCFVFCVNRKIVLRFMH